MLEPVEIGQFRAGVQRVQAEERVLSGRPCARALRAAKSLPFLPWEGISWHTVKLELECLGVVSIRKAAFSGLQLNCRVLSSVQQMMGSDGRAAPLLGFPGLAFREKENCEQKFQRPSACAGSVRDE